MTKKEFKKWWSNCYLNAENHSPNKTTVGSPLEIIKKHPLYAGNSILKLSYVFRQLK